MTDRKCDTVGCRNTALPGERYCMTCENAHNQIKEFTDARDNALVAQRLDEYGMREVKDKNGN